MLAQPSAGPRGGSEDTARQWLDTTAAVAADPAGYKARLAQLDAAQAKATERETAARAAEADAKKALDAAKAERQEADRAMSDLEDVRYRAAEESRKANKKLDDRIAAAEASMNERAAELKAKSDALDGIAIGLQGRHIELKTAIADAAAQAERHAALNADFEKAIAVANEREAAAKRALARVAALAKDPAY